MVEYVNAFATGRAWQQLIASARQRLVFLQPFMKLDSELCDQLDAPDKSRCDILFVYSHSRLTPTEVRWLAARPDLRLRWCPAMHMRCCLSELSVLLTSRGAYRQQSEDRYDMGVLIHRDQDPQLYKQVYDDVYRMVGDSRETQPKAHTPPKRGRPAEELLSDWVIAERMQLSLEAYYGMMEREGYLERDPNGRLALSERGVAVGGKPAFSTRHGSYFVWPRDVS